MIKAHPLRYMVVLLKKLPVLWLNIYVGERPTKASTVLAICNVLAAILAVIGIRTLRPPEAGVRLLVAMVVYYTVVHLVFYSIVRYTLPVYAYMFCFTAAGLVTLTERLVRPGDRLQAVP